MLNTFTTHIASDGRIVALSCNFVNLINKHDTSFGFLQVVVASLKKAHQKALDVLAHITSLGKHSGINDCERHFQELCNGFCKKCFACTCRANDNDVRLLDFHIIIGLFLNQSLVVVVNSHRKMFLRVVLTDNVFVEILFDFAWLRESFEVDIRAFGLVHLVEVFLSQLVGTLGAFVTNATVHARHQQFYLAFKSATKTTSKPLFRLFCHSVYYLLFSRTRSIIP